MPILLGICTGYKQYDVEYFKNRHGDRKIRINASDSSVAANCNTYCVVQSLFLIRLKEINEGYEAIKDSMIPWEEDQERMDKGHQSGIIIFC